MTTTETTGLERLLPTYARADLTIVRGDGCRVWDSDGREYLDFGGGIAVVSLGHCHPAPLAAAQAQLERLWHVSNLYRTEPAEQLATALSDRFGGAQTFFCNSGAEAIEAAVKYARKATGKPGVVALEGGFHGRTFGALSVTGQPAKREPFAPLVPGASFVPPNDVDALVAAVDDEVGPDPPRADPRRGRRRSARPRVRRRGRRALRRSSASTRCRPGSGGPGRSSRSSSWACARTSSRSRRVSPTDCPSAHCSSRTTRWEPSHPATMARRSAGTPSRRPRPARSSRRSTTNFSRTCRSAAPSSPRGSAAPGVEGVRGRGLLVGVETTAPAADVVAASRDQGLLVLSAGENVVRLAPPLTVAPDEVAAALDVLARVVTLPA